MLLGVLHLIQDSEDPWGIVAGLMAAMPTGSYLTISHPAIDIHHAQANASPGRPEAGWCSRRTPVSPGSRRGWTASR